MRCNDMNVESVSHNLVKSCYAMLDYNLKFQSPFYNILQHLKLRKKFIPQLKD